MATDAQVNADSQKQNSVTKHLFTVEGVGDFLIHRPTNRDIIEMGKKLTIITGGVRLVDPEAAILASVEAILTTVADSQPEAWDFGSDIDHAAEYIEFYQKYGEWLDSFRSARA